MEISVDGVAREVPALHGTMGGLIGELKKDVLSQGRVVLAVSVDGRDMALKAQGEIAGRRVDEFSTLSVKTADPRELCLATLEEVSNHIQPIIDEAGRIAELIDQGKEAQALGRIVPCLEVWSAIVRAAQNISELMQVDLNGVTANNESLPESVRALVGLLGELKAGMDARDFVAVRDAMKNRMPEVSGRIAVQLDALFAAVSAK